MKISKEEFLEAFDLCEKYIKQETDDYERLKNDIKELQSFDYSKRWLSVKRGDKIKLNHLRLNGNSKLVCGEVLDVVSVQRLSTSRGFKLSINAKKGKSKYRFSAEIRGDYLSTNVKFEII